MMDSRVAKEARRRITIERTLKAPIAEIWDMWTTKEGLESWWGPDGFAVKVHTLDLRPGGELRYAMTAVAPDQIQFMKNAGMPVTTENRGRYVEVVPPARLVFTQVADFIPGVEPYDVATTVELEAAAEGVRLVLTIDAMHDEHWTQMAVMGWEGELDKLARALQR